MAQMTTEIERVVMLLPWLVISRPNGNRSIDAHTAKMMMCHLMDTGFKEQVGTIAYEPNTPGLFKIDASNEAIQELQLQSWVSEVNPHPDQLYMIAGGLKKGTKYSEVPKRLKYIESLIEEHMLAKDILSLKVVDGVVLAVCTARGHDFLSKSGVLVNLSPVME